MLGKVPKRPDALIKNNDNCSQCVNKLKPSCFEN